MHNLLCNFSSRICLKLYQIKKINVIGKITKIKILKEHLFVKILKNSIVLQLLHSGAILDTKLKKQLRINGSEGIFYGRVDNYLQS